MSGRGQEEDHRCAADAGFDRHLVKPVDLAELKTLLAAAAETPTHPVSVSGGI